MRVGDRSDNVGDGSVRVAAHPFDRGGEPFPFGLHPLFISHS